MNIVRIPFVAALCACWAIGASAAGPQAGELRLSSTIGPIDAGIVPLLAQTYEAQSGVKLRYEGAGTNATLQKAKSGHFDLVLVHARKLEDAFVAEGFGVDRRDVMFNDFLIFGPAADPAGIKGLKSAAEAFKKLAAAQAPTVTRGDLSGTHVKELEVWEAAGLKPAGGWYERFADGAKGNKATLLHADRQSAYVLMDRATYLTVKNEVRLVPLVEGDRLLLNFIAVIAVNPARFPDVNASGARAFMDWLTGAPGQALIRSFGVAEYGQPLFFPNAQGQGAR